MALALIIFLILICGIFLVAYVIFVKRKNRKLIQQVTPITRGEKSERKLILELLKQDINPKAIFHDLYLKKPNGEYTQIDVVAATKSGIIVFEVKEYGGWIYGDEHQKYWTQSIAHGNQKNRFYNPVMQNEGHIHAIRQCLPQNPGIPIYSIIVFFGNNQFRNITCNANKTYIIHPDSVSRVMQDILRQSDAGYGNKHEIMNLFTEGVRNGDDPVIVASQINTAQYYGRNKPQSTNKLSYASLFSIRKFPLNWKFW